MCFSIEWIESLLIDVVIIVAVVAILRLLVPYLLSLIGGSANGIIMQVLNIVIWVVVIIFVIYLIFGLLSCVGGSGGIFHHYG